MLCGAEVRPRPTALFDHCLTYSSKPERAIWWAKMEGSITNAHIKDGGTFRKDRPTYAQMMNYNDVQGDMFADDDEGIACFCGE
jgi:hypothetical protein